MNVKPMLTAFHAWLALASNVSTHVQEPVENWQYVQLRRTFLLAIVPLDIRVILTMLVRYLEVRNIYILKDKYVF